LNSAVTINLALNTVSKAACEEFFNNPSQYQGALRSLLAENFAIAFKPKIKNLTLAGYMNNAIEYKVSMFSPPLGSGTDMCLVCSITSIE
jgi:hypothetical protein